MGVLFSDCLNKSKTWLVFENNPWKWMFSFIVGMITVSAVAPTRMKFANAEKRLESMKLLFLNQAG